MDFLVNRVAKRYIGKKAQTGLQQNSFGLTADVLYEEVPVLDRNGRPTRKTKKVKRSLPENISEHNAAVLSKVRQRAHMLDTSTKILGMKFGLSSLIGIIPVAGDGIDFLLACSVARKCQQVEPKLKQSIIQLMWVICIIDGLIGIAPILGDILDTLFRANTINVRLLERELNKPQYKVGYVSNVADQHAIALRPTTRVGSITEQVVNTNVDPSTNNNLNQEGQPPRYEPRPRQCDEATRVEPVRLEPARVGQKKHAGVGWLSRFTNTKGGDLERGEMTKL